MDEGGIKVGRLLGFPVQIHPSALILGFILMMPYVRAGQGTIALYLVAAIALSILLHELGHALVIRALGWESVIVLHGFGGVTLSRSRPSPGQQIGVSLAGPAVNFALLAGAFVGLLFFSTGAVAQFLDILFMVNLFLGVFNVLPIVPLDGGQAFRSVLRIFTPRRADVAAAWVSMALTVPILAWAASQRSLFMGLIALFLVFTNWKTATGQE
ncbi:MAG: site-2 protease family protein [Deltaproteobacteria bacterium]|nr:site-2 protease family protein [Deltaproteobacteria bacterium]